MSKYARMKRAEARKDRKKRQASPEIQDIGMTISNLVFYNSKKIQLAYYKN